MKVIVAYGFDREIVAIVDGGCTYFMWLLKLLMVMIVGVLLLIAMSFFHICLRW